jgi:two-component system sensor histidine kinase SenX3
LRLRAAPTQHERLPSGSGDATSREAQLDRRRLESTLDAVTDGVVIVDAEGSEVVRNVVAERFRDARHGDALVSQVIDELLDAARQGADVDRELSLFGPPREVLVIRAVPLWERGTVVGAAAFVADNTEGRRTESVRRDFVANVSHELKTPIGALGLLAETIASEADLAVVGPLADQLVREAYRLSRIVDDLLDLSLIEAQEAPTRERVSLRVLLDEATDRLAPMALAHGIPLRVDDVPEDLVVECDPGQIISAVTNLLDNAVKYSDLGQLVEVGAHDDGHGRVVITVRDRGIGIPALELERIFERFYRVDKARSRATGGTGLGLSIVRHAVYAHGGQVGVTSVEGEGSTFELVLPAAALRS